MALIMYSNLSESTAARMNSSKVLKHEAKKKKQKQCKKKKKREREKERKRYTSWGELKKRWEESVLRIL